MAIPPYYVAPDVRRHAGRWAHWLVTVVQADLW